MTSARPEAGTLCWICCHGTLASIERIEHELRAAAARHRFVVLAVHDLHSLLVSHGLESGIECRIFDLCHPLYVQQTLNGDGGASAALPNRVAVFGGSGSYTLAALRPTGLFAAMGEAVSDAAMETVAQATEDSLFEVMQEAAASIRARTAPVAAHAVA